MLPAGPARVLPPFPPWLRFALFGVVVAAAAYVLTAIEVVEQPENPRERLADVVAIPEIDDALLSTAHDDTREQRLLLEAEPLRHLLARAIDVGPTVEAALGPPEQPIPLGNLRRELPRHRGRWLFYEGVLEDLAGPREGHPIQGYSIFEAAVRLPDGEHAMAAFSMPPASGIGIGSWVRISGYLLKLRDTTYPLSIASAPLLVGRQIQPDYADWPAVVELDRTLLSTIDDSSYWPGDKAWHDIEADQTEVLWHLGAYARDTVGKRSAAEWHKTTTINAPDSYQQLVDGQIQRGAPMRVFGTLIRRTTIAAPANPANIACWTVAWVQVRELGGHLVPIWVPKRVKDLPERAHLEVRGYYYRWLAYESLTNERYRMPLFVAADLDVYDLAVGRTTRTVGMWLGGVLCALVVLLWWSQRQAAKESVAHLRDMDARRRRRRERRASTELTS